MIIMKILDKPLQDAEITHPDKIVWKQPPIDKALFISYLAEVSRFMLPFLENRALTAIRFPHGVPGESFFQKNCPDYAPEFIQTAAVGDHRYIICNDLATLIWLGNQMTVEYHVPFQTIGSDRPLEIVFDLDPADRSDFPLAVKAALQIKKILDRLEITGYPKLSGSRGLQIHIPTAGSGLTYPDSRIFTSFIARLLVENFPADFTTERLKKKRGNRLYIDYVQHAPGKTIICPYSPRGKEGATVAVPLRWEEVNESLRMEHYTIPSVLGRIARGPCPMQDFFRQENRSLSTVVASLKKQVPVLSSAGRH